MVEFSSQDVFYASCWFIVGGVISSVTEYYTGLGKPILRLFNNLVLVTTNIISGLATGMISTFPSILLFIFI